MHKTGEGGGRIAYRRGVPFAMSFPIVIPAGLAICLFFATGWVPYVVVTLIGVVGFVVGASDEQLVIDSNTRMIVVSRSLIGRTTGSDSIPFDRVSRVAVMAYFVRDDRTRSTTRDGFRLRLDWDVSTAGGGMLLETMTDEAEALAEAGRLAGILGTSVKRIEV